MRLTTSPATARLIMVGIMMVIAGVAEAINAFQIKSWGKFFLWLLLGAPSSLPIFPLYDPSS